MKGRRFPALVLLLAATVLAAGPSLRLQAAWPCAGGPPMACCDGTQTGDENAMLPCGCTLKPVTPSPAVVGAAAPPVVLAEAPAAEAPAFGVPSALCEAAVPQRARAGPLFLLHSALLN